MHEQLCYSFNQFEVFFTETLYQESGGEYAVLSNEERQMEVQFLYFFTDFIPLSHSKMYVTQLDDKQPSKEVVVVTL